ncbi:MAG: hypothetical protein KJ060_02435 [Candidatus Hydrogenedentes bacterium]|nr:hypothetical protein [Candidatus Hydrogenedentota bacterium]
MSLISRAVLAVLLGSCAVQADIIAEFEQSLGPGPMSDTATFPLRIDRPEAHHAIDVQAVLREGSGSLRIVDPSGAEVYRHLWGDRVSQELALLGPLETAGDYQIQVDMENALGGWRLRVAEVPDAAQLKSIAFAGPLLGLVGLAFVIGWRFGTGAQWRWLLAGAGLRVVAALLTLAVVLILHFTIEEALEDALPYSQYVAVNGGIVGAASGLAAVAAFLVAGLLFRGARKTAPNAIALGAGAGGTEALLSALVTILGTGMLFGGSPKSGKWMLQLAYDATMTPLLPFVEPAKFTCVTLCLMAVSGLALMAISARRWGLVIPSFLLAAGFYAVLGATPVWALEGAASKWWTVGGAVPFAIVSAIVVRWCLREWPPAAAPDEAPMQAFLRQSATADQGS